MYINQGSIELQNAIQSGVIKQPKSSFNWQDMLKSAVDPFGILGKVQNSVQHAVNTADHIFNKGLNTGEKVFNDVTDTAENAGDGLKNLTEMLTKYGPLLIGGVTVLSVLK